MLASNSSVLASSPLPVKLSLLIHKTQVVCAFFSPKSATDDPFPVFLAKPSVVVFSDYSVGHVYEVCEISVTFLC